MEDQDEAVRNKEERQGELTPDVTAGSLFGEDVSKNRERTGPPLRDDMISTWTSIIDNGIGEEERKNLVDKYPTPGNALRLRAPKLNDIVVKACSESTIKRDARLVQLQNQIAASVTAIGGVITLMLNEDGGGNKSHLQPLCDAGRLLTDVLNMEATSRKQLVSYQLDKNLKDTLVASPSDEWLFGTDLDKRVESSKQLEKTVKYIKPAKTSIVTKKHAASKHLNYKSLPRQVQGGRQGGRQAYQSRSPFNPVYRANRTGHQDQKFKKGGGAARPERYRR